jgi:hypothetical protein
MSLQSPPRCPSMAISRRVLNTTAGWRARTDVASRPLPRFFIHQGECDGCNSSDVRQALRHRIGDATLEDSIDFTLAQHLADMPLMEALLKHAQRTDNEDDAEWHILDVTPFTSFIVGSVGLLGGMAAHYKRMGRLARSLSTNRAWKASKPFLVLQPFYIMERVLGRELGNAIRLRARTIVATSDKSAKSIKGNEGYSKVFLHALEVPYVASSELATWARSCAHQSGDADRTAKRERGLVAASVGGATIKLATPTLLASCDTHDRDGQVTAPSRHGFMFHGDMGRFDFGARAAVRDIAPHLIAPTSFSDARLTRSKELQQVRESSSDVLKLNATWGQYDWFRTSSRGSSKAMLASRMCFAPQGDTMTSRRAFDSLASGCVPVIVKNIGNSRTELALGNLPFHHTINWQSIAFFLLPRSSTLGDRDQPIRGPKVQCRIGEAAWLSARYNNTRLISRMRRDAVRAFKAHMDVWGNPAGVADAVLREMAYILDEPPRRDLVSFGQPFKKLGPNEYHGLNAHLPPAHLLRAPEIETQELAIKIDAGVA